MKDLVTNQIRCKVEGGAIEGNESKSMLGFETRDWEVVIAQMEVESQEEPVSKG